MPMDVYSHPFERKDIRNWIRMSTKINIHILGGSTGSLYRPFSKVNCINKYIQLHSLTEVFKYTNIAYLR